MCVFACMCVCVCVCVCGCVCALNYLTPVACPIHYISLTSFFPLSIIPFLSFPGDICQGRMPHFQHSNTLGLIEAISKHTHTRASTHTYTQTYTHTYTHRDMKTHRHTNQDIQTQNTQRHKETHTHTHTRTENTRTSRCCSTVQC